MNAMRRMLELLLQMHEGSRRLDQALEIIRVVGRCLEPEMLEDIVRFVVTLLIPATKEPAITGIGCAISPSSAVGAGSSSTCTNCEIRSPLVIQPLVLWSEMRGKPARVNFLEGETVA